MHDVHYRLSILAKAIHHKNLSSAADHVGLSQPQLSRVIGKLEEELQVVLLDRSVRRKSGWTTSARQLSEVFVQNEFQLNSAIQKILGTQLYSTLRVGALEGLATLAMYYVRALFNETEIKEIHLDIFEISELESRFEARELDLIFSFKVPGRQKHENSLEVGYQSITSIDNDGEFLVYSPYEFSQQKIKEKKLTKKVFLSNSLFLRKQWLKKFRGTGFSPSRILLKPSEGKFPLYLVGSELLSPQLWDRVLNIPRTSEMLNADLFED
jgi:molybdenum-dependent DNA-binding transcriptional regulator ModE